MNVREEGTSLEAMPNIGKVVADRLREAGIATPADLRRVGSVEAALRLAARRPHDPPCRSMLSGLEGAIRSVRWHAISKEEREERWAEYCASRGAPRGNPEAAEEDGHDRTLIA